MIIAIIHFLPPMQKGDKMYLVVDANWAKRYPELAAKIQVAHLLKRVRALNGEKPRRVNGSEWRSPDVSKSRMDARNLRTQHL